MAQSVLSGTDTGEPSLLLDMKSDHQGILIPRFDEAARNALPNPAAGTQIINTETGCLEIFNGISWIPHCGLITPTEEIDSSLLGTDVWKELTVTNTSDFATFEIDHKIHYVNTAVGYHKVFDPATVTWMLPAADFSGPFRLNSAVFKMGELAIVAGGVSFSASNPTAVGVALQDVWAYDPSTNSWSQKANLPSARENAFAFSIGDKGFVGGGSKQGTLYPDFYEFDLAANQWIARASLPVGRTQAASFSIGRKGYVATGKVKVGNSILNDSNVLSYDPSSDTWTTMASLSVSEGRYSALGFTLDGMGYFGFGKVSEQQLHYDLWQFDPNESQLRKMKSAPDAFYLPRNGFAVVNDRAYIGGFYKTWVYQNKRYSQSTPLNTLPNSTFKTGTWSKENGIITPESVKIGIGKENPVASLDINGTLSFDAWQNQDLSDNGYVLMGGLLLQWGTSAYSSSAEKQVNYPTPFGNLFSLTASLSSGANNGSGANVPVKTMNVGNSNFFIAGTKAFSNDNVSKIRWMAVGTPP
ncbi:hypothetical protein AFM12_14875 [Jiulongibacter sediminis]|uniref:Putative tail fiber protein gp53-like C-terminal domain-containing protein n=2 Tax=Jiulongibacter sediminis TaxID=1605367 RepID=A0A0P7C5J4_9BACT|nr:hypothetical protein AFM12_14875 [Jiulongibacter sediminis]TBX23013.1 hypothetical protein TK44_14885 [Jiulongibacter sediminis]